MINLIQRNPYCFPTLVAALIGLLFPLCAIGLLVWHQNLSLGWHDISSLHRNNYALLIIWSAPLVLGVFGFLVGKFNGLLNQKMDSLKHQTTQLNTILDTAPSAIITIDQHGIVTSFNKAAEKIFGYSQVEIIGKNVSCLMPDTIAPQHDGYIQRYLQTGQATIIGKRREVEARRKNGQFFPALLRVKPMRIDNETFFSGVIDDISDTKALQTQLVQAQKLEAIGQLAAGVAHEINTPIQYIGDNLSALKQNFSDLLAYHQALNALADDTLKPRLAELDQQYDIDYILEDSPNAIRQSLEGIDRVAEIVKAMKTFSHIDQGQNKQIINLHEALKGALTISRNSYKYLANVETDFADDVGGIECYASQLNQVFLNLIINAAHAIEEKQAGTGLIRIVTRNLGDSVEILIQDNGAGIPEPIREKVFNLFFTTKPVGKGTGQGLSLAHSIIVETHRGKLFFESEAGHGTTFHIQLPIKLA
ncbi:PAS domain S-box protein [Methylomonas sp. LL1]|uniref:two-component system sensor histidine kinase NtrB n=1 Tax=Methylomonas sp. LL1 TaxID=2785785 RepID=UPI0018C41CC4|nr:PAS domain S-box protein [Methylomonas sp. LL1]QPK65288.1 PAS domain S-box protein [Methylomonas sp. LL1]